MLWCRSIALTLLTLVRLARDELSHWQPDRWRTAELRSRRLGTTGVRSMMCLADVSFAVDGGV